MNPASTKAVLEDVEVERGDQEAEWGQMSAANLQDLGVCLAILMEEVGEASEAYLDLKSGDGQAADMDLELIQVAAVAVAMVENLRKQYQTKEKPQGA